MRTCQVVLAAVLSTALPIFGHAQSADGTAGGPFASIEAGPTLRPPNIPERLAAPSATAMAKAMDSKGRGSAGSVVIGCILDAKGRPDPCKVIRETPADAGLGEAALVVAGQFRFKMTTPDRKSIVGETIWLPIAFRPPR